MKKCSFCGNSNFETDHFCNKCGRALDEVVEINIPSLQEHKIIFTSGNAAPVHNRGLKTAAYVFLLITTILQWVFFAVFLVSFLILSGVELPDNLFGFAIERLVGTGIITSWISALVASFSLGHFNRRVADRRRIGTGFKVFILLFVNVIAGILMLCDNEW